MILSSRLARNRYKSVTPPTIRAATMLTAAPYPNSCSTVEPDVTGGILRKMEETFDIHTEIFGEREFLFLPRYHQSERYCADRLKMMLRYPPQSIVGAEGSIKEIEIREGIHYAAEQKQAIVQALEKGFLILTGGPGTGKTTTLNGIIRILKEKGETVLLAAPTGRAAKRMSELTGEEAAAIAGA